MDGGASVKAVDDCGSYLIRSTGMRWFIPVGFQMARFSFGPNPEDSGLTMKPAKPIHLAPTKVAEQHRVAPSLP
jgi:hypothetical protein